VTTGGEHDAYLLERIRDRLAADERVHELELELQVSAGRIVVRGRVPTPERRRAIGEVIAEVAPDHDVSNETELVDLSVDGRQEEVT